MAPKLKQAARRARAKAKAATLSGSSATASENMAKRVRQNDGSTTAKEARVAEQPPLRVAVHTLSGNLLCMLEVSPGDSALVLYRSAEAAAGKPLQLFTSAGHYLKAASTIAAAGLRDEAVVTASVALPRLFTTSAVAALKGDGSVLTWGSSDAGGDSRAVRAQLSEGVAHIVTKPGRGWGAMAAIKENGDF